MADKKVTKPVAGGDDEFTVDMTTAKTLEPLPTNRPFLVACSKWKKGKTGEGKRKVDFGFTVVSPEEFKNRQIIGSSSLENEYTLGTVKQMLVNMGIPGVAEATAFKIPDEDEMMGMQMTVYPNLRKSEQYGDRNGIARMRPAASYEELATS